ncbi:uncharacterized protein EAF02_004485 [Botrytis sinoallii]|uniref:uncharacterized protein n=1 Tax=Botrytis sinoallii TaxID=1463999 RepID=UPI001901F289|nr:uncharacterized protein EAF02_004485 [Botrytis sinoallii]KAF7885976.1 hypothetical protein EAF02_004485 [Botrytis sinoallii]
MKTTQIVALAVLLATVSAKAIPTHPKSQLKSTPKKTIETTSLHFYNGTCTAETIRVRKEWRNMSTSEKSAYLQAEQCLFNLPAATTLSGVTSRFSDLQSLHRDKTNQTIDGLYVQDIIHNVGQFLPWHRYYMHAHETLLRTECGYTGPMSWWDEAQDADAGAFFQSDMWTAEYFGSPTLDESACVIDGAFANTTEHIGPLLENTDYCFYRAFDLTQVQYCTSEKVAECTQYNDYYSFFNCMVIYPTSPHVAGHAAVGGMMADIDCSAGDPAFFIHHNYIDRMWWQWQQANATSRMFDISGNSLNETYLAEQGDVAPAADWPQMTLEYTLTTADILPDVQIYDVVNIQGGYLCYEYDY